MRKGSLRVMPSRTTPPRQTTFPPALWQTYMSALRDMSRLTLLSQEIASDLMALERETASLRRKLYEEMAGISEEERRVLLNSMQAYAKIHAAQR
jgi:hypothetical protein